MPTVVTIPADMLTAVDSVFTLGRRHITSPQPFTAHLRASGPTDERWIVELTLQVKTREDLDRFESIFDTGDGLAGFYTAFDAVHGVPTGTATGLETGLSTTRFSDGTTFSDGTFFADGLTSGTIGAAASRGAEFVTLDGLTASQTTGFAIGDMFSIAPGSEKYGFLHRAVAVAPTDASGVATVRIRPRLRADVMAGQIVHYYQPRGVFRLTEEGASSFSRGPGGLGQPVLSLVEAPEVLLCAL